MGYLHVDTFERPHCVSCTARCPGTECPSLWSWDRGSGPEMAAPVLALRQPGPPSHTWSGELPNVLGATGVCVCRDRVGLKPGERTLQGRNP